MAGIKTGAYSPSAATGEVRSDEGVTSARATDASSEVIIEDQARDVAARHLGLTAMGVLAPGYSADFVILSANPLDDIRNTRAIDSVYLRGQSVDREALSAAWTTGN